MLVQRQYDCGLVTDGFRIRVTVFTSDKTKVDELAREQAAERLRQSYGIDKAPVEFVVVEVIERIFH